jgi:hypothetical protein
MPQPRWSDVSGLSFEANYRRMPALAFMDLFSPDCPATRFYDVLPGDADAPRGDGCSRTNWAECFARLRKATFDEVEQPTLDELALLLLAPNLAVPPHAELRALADHCSRLYIQAFRERSAQTLKKMSLQRLNFFLRSLLDREVLPPPGAYETPLDGLCPWDWLETPAGTLRVVSGEPNIVLESSSGRRTWRQGLPTQADAIRPGAISIGSFYSDGASLLRGETLQHVEHDAPVVLLFEHAGRPAMLDARGRLFDWLDGAAAPGPPRMQLDVGVVARARRFASRLYVIDWTTIGNLQAVDLNRDTVERLDVSPVMVPNDVAEFGGFRYLLDKQQGQVFKFDDAWRLVARQCGFGRGPGRLFDPLTIRPSADGRWLRVLNWAPATLTSIPIF